MSSGRNQRWIEDAEARRMRVLASEQRGICDAPMIVDRIPQRRRVYVLIRWLRVLQPGRNGVKKNPEVG